MMCIICVIKFASTLYIYIYTHTHIYIYTHTHIYIYIYSHVGKISKINKMNVWPSTCIFSCYALSWEFLYILSELAIGLILLIQTTILCLITRTIYRRFWFSYTLFIIIIGGILVLFIYITCRCVHGCDYHFYIFSVSWQLDIISCVVLRYDAGDVLTSMQSGIYWK